MYRGRGGDGCTEGGEGRRGGEYIEEGEGIDVQREGGMYIAMEGEKKNLKQNEINLIYPSLDQIVLSHSPRQSWLKMSELPLVVSYGTIIAASTTVSVCLSPSQVGLPSEARLRPPAECWLSYAQKRNAIGKQAFLCGNTQLSFLHLSPVFSSQKMRGDSKQSMISASLSQRSQILKQTVLNGTDNLSPINCPESYWLKQILPWQEGWDRLSWYLQVEESVSSGCTNSSQRDISVLELTIIFSSLHSNTIPPKKQFKQRILLQMAFFTSSRKIVNKGNKGDTQ